MYNLGEQFKFDYEKAKPNTACVFKGQKYRITVLTERLVRLEYSENGVFEDKPTELVWYRNLTKPEFEVKEEGNILEITTKYFTLTYIKEKPFYGGKINPTANLKIACNNSDRYWYYKHPEVRNYGAPSLNLSDNKGRVIYHKSLYSLDGFSSFDDSKSKVMLPTGEVKSRENNEIDVYVFTYLKEFSEALNDYFKITGYPDLIPRYALGNWWSRNNTYNDEELFTLINNFEMKRIPISVLLLDKDWHNRVEVNKQRLKTGFTFNKELFASPFDMISYMHQKGIKVGLNVNPFEGIYPNEERYNIITKYLEPDKKGVIPYNIFNSKFVDAYLKILIHPLNTLGVDFFWIDYFDKTKLEELFLLKHYHFYDMARSDKRSMVFGYNTNMAGHRYGILYSGKTTVGWDTLRLIPLHNLNASNNGISWWSHDIGGYHKGIEDNELYTRFVQLGVFSPILKFGADEGKYYKREPWRWSVKTYSIVKDYLTLRHRLIPYLYTEAYKYYSEGKPIIEPVYYKFPEMYDEPLYKDEYYFGSQLFVSPITTPKDHIMNRVIHKFFMPDGIWYDFVTGKKFPGGRNYVSFFKDQDYPVFARSGAIIPFGDNDNLNDTSAPKNLEIQIFPGRSNTYVLYEDDGTTNLYKQGYFLKTSIDYNYMPNNYTVIIRAIEGKSGMIPEKRNYKITFRNTKKANDVIAYFNNDKVEYNSYVSGADFVVEIKDVPSIGQLTLNCKGKDIEIDAIRLINEDIETIISDLQIPTELKEKIDAVLFSDEPINKKRIGIRKLGNKGLEHKFVKLFLKLLEYIDQV